MPLALQAYLAERIWLCSYPVRYLGMEFHARMTVIRLDDGRLTLHSPCEIDDHMRRSTRRTQCGRLHRGPRNVSLSARAFRTGGFPEAETFICPGIESKRPEMHFDWLLGDVAPAAWAGPLEQVLVRGSRWICELAFFHQRTKTLILVDLIEKFTDATPQVDWMLKLWWKLVFHIWNTARPAPEYQLGWSDKKAARASLHRILQWDFERVILAHGDLIEADARQVVEKAWRKPLSTRLRVTLVAPTFFLNFYHRALR